PQGTKKRPPIKYIERLNTYSDIEVIKTYKGNNNTIIFYVKGKQGTKQVYNVIIWNNEFAYVEPLRIPDDDSLAKEWENETSPILINVGENEYYLWNSLHTPKAIVDGILPPKKEWILFPIKDRYSTTDTIEITIKAESNGMKITYFSTFTP
ncbi:hypothetical protein V0R37_21765, partial [Pollutimonas sp. H1-120]|uniref:hypothetical protein n=1 Tax=Pollutimonas sp. H1-120 TaxID=3148824 RepID=UPI003B522861